MLLGSRLGSVISISRQVHSASALFSFLRLCVNAARRSSSDLHVRARSRTSEVFCDENVLRNWAMNRIHSLGLPTCLLGSRATVIRHDRSNTDMGVLARAVSATPPSIATVAPVLGGPECVRARVVLNNNSSTEVHRSQVLNRHKQPQCHKQQTTYRKPKEAIHRMCSRGLTG